MAAALVSGPERIATVAPCWWTASSGMASLLPIGLGRLPAQFFEYRSGYVGGLPHGRSKLLVVEPLSRLFKSLLPSMAWRHKPFQDAELDQVLQAGSEPPPTDGEVEVVRFVLGPTAALQHRLHCFNATVQMKVRFWILVRRITGVIVSQDRLPSLREPKLVAALGCGQEPIRPVESERVQQAKLQLRRHPRCRQRYGFTAWFQLGDSVPDCGASARLHQHGQAKTVRDRAIERLGEFPRKLPRLALDVRLATARQRSRRRTRPRGPSRS